MYDAQAKPVRETSESLDAGMCQMVFSVSMLAQNPNAAAKQGLDCTVLLKGQAAQHHRIKARGLPSMKIGAMKSFRIVQGCFKFFGRYSAHAQLNQQHAGSGQCNAMQCNAMQCNAMQRNATQRNAMQGKAMQGKASMPLQGVHETAHHNRGPRP